METVIEAFMKCLGTSTISGGYSLILRRLKSLTNALAGLIGKSMVASLNGAVEAETIKPESANCQADVDYLNAVMRFLPDGTV
jgi:hypothetical protein